VPVEARPHRAILAAAADGRLVLPPGALLDGDLPRGVEVVLGRTPEGTCLLHNPTTNLCAVHAAVGEAALPDACRHFPRIALRDARGTFVTLSHYCPTAARSLIEDTPLAIVESPPAFPEGDYEGLDAVAELPPLPAVPLHADAEPLEALLRNVLSIACLSETVAVALIGAERELAGPPAMQSTLTAILADEVGHARFGWRLLETLGPRLTPELRARLGDYLIVAFRHLREHELAHLPPQPAPSARAESFGVCDGHEARALFFETVRSVIIPGLEAHGIPAERAWVASGG
jgi:hypothetical protein